MQAQALLLVASFTPSGQLGLRILGVSFSLLSLRGSIPPSRLYLVSRLKYVKTVQKDTRALSSRPQVTPDSRQAVSSRSIIQGALGN